MSVTLNYALNGFVRLYGPVRFSPFMSDLFLLLELRLYVDRGESSLNNMALFGLFSSLYLMLCSFGVLPVVVSGDKSFF
jgi:hypothetical protein